jgi:hypothetical protein
MEKFRVNIASLPDRERLVSEIFLGDTQVAEINQEGDHPRLEIYPRPEGGAWDFDLDSFLETVVAAKQALLGR